MLTKKQFLDDCAHEVRVIQHLATKVLPASLDWRPTPRQRSIRELLQYLAACAIVPAKAVVTGSWEHAEADEKATESVTPEGFAKAMDAQMEALRRLVEPIPETDLFEKEAALPWGTKVTWGQALVDMALKTLVAYRMQLFLWAKESGNLALGPTNCWIGVDRPAPAATETSRN
jgi:hypothetical protein